MDLGLKPLTKEKKGKSIKLTQDDLERGYEGGCDICTVSTLKGEAKIGTRGKGNPEVLIFGEAAGRTEAEAGIPFVGKSGELLNKVLHVIDADNYLIDNIIRCRPTDSANKDREPTVFEQSCCLRFTLLAFEKIKPTVVITLGQSPTSFLLQQAKLDIHKHSMQVLHGRRLLCSIKLESGLHWYYLYPMYHPSFLLRNGVSLARLDNRNYYHELFTTFVNELRNAFNSKNKKLPKKFFVNEYLTNIKFVYDAETFLTECNSLGSIIALDFETTTLKTYDDNARVTYIALSNYTKTVVITLETEENKKRAFVTDEVYEKVIKALKEILKNKIIIVHYIPMEFHWFIGIFGEEFAYSLRLRDTMVQTYLIHGKRSEKGSQKLEFLTQQFLGVNVKALTQVDRTNLSKTSIKDNMLYNALDAKSTFWLYVYQFNIITNNGLNLVEAMKTTDQLLGTVMSTKGIKPDIVFVQKLKADYTIELEKVIKELSEIKLVQEYKQKIGHSPNLSSEIDLKNIFILAGLDSHIELEFGKLKTDKNVIEYIIKLYENGVITDQKIVDFVKLLILYRDCNKMISTYLIPFTSDSKKIVLVDGVVHTNFDTTGTITGRFASRQPNLQNLPIRKTAQFRRIFDAGTDNIFISFDCGQIEARIIAITLAVVLKDYTFCDYLWQGKDIHGDITQFCIEQFPEAVYNSLLIKCDNDSQKASITYRKMIKNTFTFPYIYLAGLKKLMNLNKINEEQLRLVIEFVDNKLPIKEWQQILFKELANKGYLTALTGFRVYSPLSYTDVVNYVIQHTAVQILNDVLKRLVFNRKLHAVIQVHDEGDLICHKDKFDYYIQCITEESTILDKYPKHWQKWLQLAPLTFTISSGESFGDLKPYRELTTTWERKYL